MTQTFNRTTFFGLLKAADTAVLKLQEYVAQNTMDRATVTDEVTRYVAQERKVAVKDGQRGMTFSLTGKALRDAINRRSYLLSLIYMVPKGSGKSNDTDPVAQAIKVCSKLSWSDWAKVVKAIEATR